MTKKTILVFVDWFWPGYLAGGPVQSVTSLVTYLNDYYHFKVITTDRDLHATEPYAGIRSDVWTRSELGCEVFYLSPQNTNARVIRRLIEETNTDCIYINSFFSFNFSVLPLLLIKILRLKTLVIVAPRGMLGRGALSIKKYKKKLFLFAARLSGLHKNVCWHATSDEELKEIIQVLGAVKKTAVVPNLPKKLAPVQAPVKEAGQLSLCFISRITHKKNLLFAIEALADVTCSTRLRIYGPLEDQAYWEKCVARLEKLSSPLKYSYEGTVNPGEVRGVFANNHVMILPTLNENFGHAIIEALSCGCPVIISDQTPWNDIEKYGAGFAIPLSDKGRFTNVIQHYCEMDQAGYERCRQNALHYVHEKINTSAIILQYKNLFNDCIKN